MSFPPNIKEYNRNDVGPQGALVRDSHTLCEPTRADADSPSQLVGERLSENLCSPFLTYKVTADFCLEKP